MNRPASTVDVVIDNTPIRAEAGVSILDVARQNDIYIPTLCYHEHLSPHGGCRMCIVEVEGLRTFPTACTTPVADGMVIRTHTAQIQEMRGEILQLFLSEHTASCLVCDEQAECRSYMSTVRKAGVTTGCRYCPKDGQCELQAVTETLGVRNIIYPIYYRGIRVETEDPFYDRDYNLCILCGRCVRMCQEVRLADVLAYKHRGRQTIIGPAFTRTHLESGCEFCGACVSVCPTGTLREKARAWEGAPEQEHTTTCTFCGVGCQVRLLTKEDRIIGSLPADDTLINNGQLCVKGRFCNTELVNGHQRVRHPYRTEGAISWDVSWDEAYRLIAEKLQSARPERTGMLVSPNLCSEDLYVAQKFMRVALQSHNIDSSARLFYGAGFNEYLSLLRDSVPLSAVQQASAVLMVGLDTRYSRSVVGVALRTAMKKGISIFTLHSREHTFSLKSDVWLRPRVGEEYRWLQQLLRLIEGEETVDPSFSSGERERMQRVARELRESTDPVILVGSEYLQYDSSRMLLSTIGRLARLIGGGVMPLPAQNNLTGSLLTGTYPELLPGLRSASDGTQSREIEQLWGRELPPYTGAWNADAMLRGAESMDVLYAVGELPPDLAVRPGFMVFQNMYPPDPYCTADLVLPSAASTEVHGSFVNGERRLQRVRRAVAPPGNARPDWSILCGLARFMGVGGFDFERPEEIREEMSHLIPLFGEAALDAREHVQLPDGAGLQLPSNGAGPPPATDESHPYLFHAYAVENSHRGFPLSAWVDGAKMLFTEGTLEISPDDARELELRDGDTVAVRGDGIEKQWPVRVVRTQPRGTLRASLLDSAAFHPNPQPVSLRKADV